MGWAAAAIPHKITPRSARIWKGCLQAVPLAGRMCTPCAKCWRPHGDIALGRQTSGGAPAVHHHRPEPEKRAALKNLERGGESTLRMKSGNGCMWDVGVRAVRQRVATRCGPLREEARTGCSEKPVTGSEKSTPLETLSLGSGAASKPVLIALGEEKRDNAFHLGSDRLKLTHEKRVSDQTRYRDCQSDDGRAECFGDAAGNDV